MPKKAKKQRQEDYQQIAKRILDTIVPDAEKPKPRDRTDGKPNAGRKRPRPKA